jgi:MFS family permease
MYQVANPVVLLRERRRLVRAHGRDGARAHAHAPAVSRTVLLLGTTSLLTDISSEMVVTILPLYLVFIGGFSPLAFGVIDGLYNGATALMGLASGFLGDRLRRHKEIASIGYGVSAVCKLLLALVGTGLTAIGAVVLLDRAGKGIRTAPRDAMISLSTPKDKLGAAFGVHRALDTTGAMLGPLVAFGILAASPTAFHSIFLISFFIALMGVAFLVLLVSGKERAADAAEPAGRPDIRQAFGMLRVKRFRAVLIAGAVLSLATASDAFIFLALDDAVDFGSSLFPLLFVGSASTYMLLAVPFGRLADRIGRVRVFFGGYVLLALVYLVVLSPLGGGVMVALALGLLGAYYAATDGVLMAIGSGIVPDEIRGSGLALLGTVTSVAKLLASVIFGALWTVTGIDTAMAVFGGGLLIAAGVAALVLRRAPQTERATA